MSRYKGFRQFLMEKEAAQSKDPRLARAGVSGYNQVKRTPGHPTKSHIVVAKEGDRVKTIRFGQQGVKTNQTAGQREAFKSRHRKNIARGKMSAAYWADKAKWSPKKTKDKDNQKWVKGASAPKLISISGMTDQEVQQTYSNLIDMAKKKKAKMEASKPGSLRHKWHSSGYESLLRDADSFREKKEVPMHKVAAYRMILRRHPLWQHEDLTKQGSAAVDLLQYAPDFVSNMDPAAAAGLITMAKVNLLNRYGPKIPVLKDIFGKYYRSGAHAGLEAGIRGEKGLSGITRFGLSAVDPNIVDTYEKGLEAGRSMRNANATKESVLDAAYKGVGLAKNPDTPNMVVQAARLGGTNLDENAVRAGLESVANKSSGITSAGEQISGNWQMGNRLGRALTLPVNKNLPKNLRNTLKGQY